MTKVNTLKLNDSRFPSHLREIPMAPAQIYWIGEDLNSWLDKPKLAIVGTRKLSSYGRLVTDRFAGQAAAAGIVIISGLALGADATAHQTALTSGGVTIAVLPTPVEKIYPTRHYNLAQQIISHGGAIISEHAKESPIYKANFTRRNRIISGLADGVLITEASLRSGSLTTARFALEQGKTVMAVPGDITASGSEGTNQLIKAGAIPVTSIDDIYLGLNLTPKKLNESRTFRGSDQQLLILNLLNKGISDQEDLAMRTGLGGAEIASLLISLEISGQIRPTGGGQWIKT
jgi:DNA processing protein